MAPRTRSEQLRRRAARIEPRDRILIVCEGAATEPEYFDDLRQELRARSVEIEVDRRSGVPKTLVERAVALKRDAERKARREGDTNLRYDEVWCVFDRDTHPHVPEALQQADANGIRVALSNPCFELWILLHFQDQRAHLDAAAALSCCRRHVPRYDKHIRYRDLKENYSSAVRRAIALEEWQASRGCRGHNPTTNVYVLTERLHAFGKLALLRALRR